MEKPAKTVKGFTLIELIIVLAIFSALMAGALKLLKPVERIFSSTTTYESTASMVNNINRYIEGSIRYCEAMDVYDGCNFEESYAGTFDPQNLTEAVDQFRRTYYPSVLRYEPSAPDEVVPATGTINVLVIDNSVDTDLDSNGIISDDEKGGYGKISKIEYGFQSDTPITEADVTLSQEYAVNRSYFDGASHFMIRLGEWTLQYSQFTETNGTQNSGYKIVCMDPTFRAGDFNLTYLAYPASFKDSDHASIKRDGVRKVTPTLTEQTALADSLDENGLLTWVASTSQRNVSSMALTNIYFRGTDLVAGAPHEFNGLGVDKGLYYVRNGAGQIEQFDSSAQIMQIYNEALALANGVTWTPGSKIYLIYSLSSEMDCNVGFH